MTPKNEIYDQMEWGQLVDANGVPVETFGGNDWGQKVDANGVPVESYGIIADEHWGFVKEMQPKHNLFKKIFKQKVKCPF